MSIAYFIIFLVFCGEKRNTISILSKKNEIRGVLMSFGGVPQWFFIIAVAFAICFVLYAEWNSRK